MQGVIQDYFNSIFSSQGNLLVGVDSCNSSKVTSDHNSLLKAPLLPDEVRSVIFSMPVDKSPGPNGFNPAFFKQFWNVL